MLVAHIHTFQINFELEDYYLKRPCRDRFILHTRLPTPCRWVLGHQNLDPSALDSMARLCRPFATPREGPTRLTPRHPRARAQAAVQLSAEHLAVIKALREAKPVPAYLACFGKWSKGMSDELKA